MTPRPSRGVIAAEVIALIGAVAVSVLADPFADWNLGPLALLLAMAIISDLIRIELPVKRTVLSASFLAIVIAAVFFGGPPAALAGVLTMIVSWVRERYSLTDLLINAVAFAWFPLIAGMVFHGVADWGSIAEGSTEFYLLVFGVFCLALAIDFGLIAGYTCYQDRSSFRAEVNRALVPLLPSELASAILALAVALAYVEVGTEGVALFGVLVLVFQALVRALLTSQERADELERRAKQLAGFQVALLSALLRTLDLRDRMTARHSAAVARYAREIAADAGYSAEDQDVAHAAGLLHDIGKFVLPDHILKTTRRGLDAEEWAAVKRHPEEGARIVSQIEGYAPISEVIIAHHERIDGQGYPHGLSGDEIPALARIVAVADSYDVMTARDSYREPMSSFEAIAEMRRVSGTQLDGGFVEALVRVLNEKEPEARTGRDADFEAELASDRRIHDYVAATPSATAELAPS